MKDFLNRILNHEQLTREETKQILLGITRSEYPDEQITALLTGLQMRGVSVDELLGFRDGILETGVAAPLHHERYIDVVGTGGDRKNTFNISTTACFVIAGAGYKVAKHGNYAATSTSGASNVIANHGVRFTDDLDRLNRSMDEAGIVYLHAQLFAKAMKFVGPIRKALQFPTVFNLLGPIVNPSQPKCQLLRLRARVQPRRPRLPDSKARGTGRRSHRGRGCCNLRQCAGEPCATCSEEHCAGQCRLRNTGAGERQQVGGGVYRHSQRIDRQRTCPGYVPQVCRNKQLMPRQPHSWLVRNVNLSIH